ncbi:MAG TPA: hypothetical protein DDW42_08040 [Desulfobacteraceae bacterium]|nr:hypothetical protein [Desulfobacteraceae bacterium]
MKSLAILKDIRFSFTREVIFVFLLGFVIRLFACQYTYIVNPDGVLYIHQARAIYYGLWDSIASCSLSYVSNYSVLIAAAYTVFHDWIIAARAVSLLFGSLTLIPIYFMLKRFFDEHISALGTLVFALMPTFVGRSSDVVRGPIYWFFLTLGLYLFISQIEKTKYRIYLFFSCVCFLMAAWARIEALLFTVISCFYIIGIKQERKFEKLAIFIIPVALSVFFALAIFVIGNAPVKDIFRIHEVAEKLFTPFIEYRGLRASLAELNNSIQLGALHYFLCKAKTLIWFIAFGTLMIYIVKVFFYPFFFIFIVGVGGIKARLKNDRSILYLVLLSIFTMILLYFHVLQTWIMENRFLALFVFPCCVWIGFGLESIISFLRSRLKLKNHVILPIVCLLILGSALPKDLKPREVDKTVFKQIGNTIARREGSSNKIAVAASQHTIRWISFYANLKYKGAPCPYKYGNLEDLAGNSYSQFVHNLKKEGIRYFLWEERHWPQKRYNFIKWKRSKDFVEIGHWRHPDTGRMVLLEVI